MSGISKYVDTPVDRVNGIATVQEGDQTQLSEGEKVDQRIQAVMYDREEVAKLKFNCFFLSHQRNNLCSSHCCNQDEERKCDELYHGNYSLHGNIDHIILERSLTCTVFPSTGYQFINMQPLDKDVVHPDGWSWLPFWSGRLLELPHRPAIHPDHPSHGKK